MQDRDLISLELFLINSAWCRVFELHFWVGQKKSIRKKVVLSENIH